MTSKRSSVAHAAPINRYKIVACWRVGVKIRSPATRGGPGQILTPSRQRAHAPLTIDRGGVTWGLFQLRTFVALACAEQGHGAFVMIEHPARN